MFNYTHVQAFTVYQSCSSRITIMFNYTHVQVFTVYQSCMMMQEFTQYPLGNKSHILQTL